MFTGIIEEIGEIVAIKEQEGYVTYRVECQEVQRGQAVGASIAIDGVCTTVTSLDQQGFTLDAIAETLEKTTFKDFFLGRKVNLESALTLNKGIDGHLVQCHVDGTGEVVSLERSSDRVRLSLNFPGKLGKYIAIKGSIVINGVSLTVTNVEEDLLAVDLIPHTLDVTNLALLKTGDRVNLEVDLLARYLEKLLKTERNENS